MSDLEFQQAFATQERRDRISNSILASVLSIILMPAGTLMDRFAYPEHADLFLKLRLASSLLVGLAWLWFHVTGKKHYKTFGVMWYAFPTLFILWMIYAANDPISPYYAGLNLVLLALGLLSPWSFKQNVISAGCVICAYLGVSFFMKVSLTPGALLNNLFFLTSTASIVVGGSYAAYTQRVREFQLRWELDKSRRIVEESNQKLIELDQIKSRFFANISHELRTPLTLLLSPLETMLHRFNRTFDDETRSLLGTMHANGMRLLKLINDLLDLVRLESGRMEVKNEPLEVKEFIKGLAAAVRQVANDKKIHLDTSVDPALGTIAADRDKLEKILLNLLFNALKFTPSGGFVTLQAEKQNEEVVLIVSDTGVGISEKNLPYVFDRFWQADGSSKRKYQGVGIGLALVKELTEIHGGKVTVESTEGKGTRFTVKLPYHVSDRTAPAPSPAQDNREKIDGTVSSEEWLANLYRRAEFFPSTASLQDTMRPIETSLNSDRPTILMADDEPDMLRFLKSQLAKQYQVIEAVDGLQAVEKAAQFLPDIILLDMMMPEKDGLQACREIREHTSTQSIPVILLTARADEETKLKALEVGASDFLAKPFSTTELHVRIKNLVESHEYQQELSKKNQILETTIEQLKETEMQLVQTEKLASLGRMSAGIIHEINNPLNFATTGLFTLRNKGKHISQEHQEEYAEILKDIEDGIKRVRNIVSDLRSFTHHDNEMMDQIEVDEVVTASLRFMSHEWRNTIKVVQSITPHQAIWANRNKLIQVLVNLFQNAIDALAKKEFAQGEQPTLWIEGTIENDRSILKIRDNGEGIKPEIMDKIFDPFFTTKDVGEGMGLGLSICYRIVQQYDGRILVKSEPGKPTEFVLEFPMKGKPDKTENT